jgi:putative FmdB family regulatory protein
MPIFEFRCKTCGRTWDELTSYDQSIKLDDRSCPTCHEFTVERAVTAPGFFNMKGEGFYKKGYS